MLVYAAIVPHSPILIPEIGRDHVKKLKKTSVALGEIKKALHASRAETILIISPHGSIIPDAFTINLSETYTVSLQEFGNFRSETVYKTDHRAVDHMQRHLRNKTSFMLHSEESLDYGSSVPLILLADSKARVVPVHTSLLDPKAHFQFGDYLKNEVMETNRRIAVIASADFTYTPKDQGSARAKKIMQLDKYIISCIESRNAPGLLQIDPATVKLSKMCGFGPTLVLHGLLERINTIPKVLSYESALGVGCITATFPMPV